ncbi:hypothetical protein RG963_13620 [Methanosarcina sp. Z-7115]|uniref:Lipoprotein n=1 Tax=Methanosarcina baikalica TaxID=3073890 RepID=A0ABU2D4C8_9EURY|nr:DUF6803 family protein [Methanosarcina sp. Z-7115]MDR7666798.1 hypothetical protein [Methanosarcina sp. Z-7115]
MKKRVIFTISLLVSILLAFFLISGCIADTAIKKDLKSDIFLFGITLLELGMISKNTEKDAKMKLHFLLLVGFLIVAHIAMIFGMLNILIP